MLYNMGIGFGADNKGENVPEDAIGDGEEYNLTCTAIKLTGYTGNSEVSETETVNENNAGDTAVGELAEKNECVTENRC